MSAPNEFKPVDVPADLLDAMPGSFRGNVRLLNINAEMRTRFLRSLLDEIGEREKRMNPDMFTKLRAFAQGLLEPKNP